VEALWREVEPVQPHDRTGIGVHSVL
jgi:hypothetical protein